jgi:hypothetical protein
MNIHSPLTDSPALLNPPRASFSRMFSWGDDLRG